MGWHLDSIQSHIPIHWVHCFEEGEVIYLFSSFLSANQYGNIYRYKITLWRLWCYFIFFADVYNIVSNRGTVGRFCLFKSAYRIGEEIVGSFDFSESFIICLKVNILIGSSRQALAGLSVGFHSPVALIFTPVTVLENCINYRPVHM